MQLAGRPGYRWVILVLGFLGIFGAAGLSRFGYSAVLPDMQRALNLSGAQAGSLASWNLAGYAIMALAGGFLAARLGARKVVTAGMFITGVGLFATAWVDGLVEASAYRFITGLGNGMVMAPSVALLSSWFPTRQRGLASAFASSGTGLGLVVAGPTVPALVQAYSQNGWRVAWYLFAAVAVFMGVLTLIFGRDRPQNQLAGTARTTSSSKSRDTKTGAAQSGLRSDLRAVLGSSYSWHLGLIYFMYGFSYLIYYTFFQKRLTVDLGVQPTTAGSLFLLAGLASIACGVLWGVVSDRLGRGAALALVLGVQATASLLFAIRPTTATLVISALIFGSAVFSVPGLIGAACGDRFGSRLAFASLGFVSVFIGAGQATGPYVGGVLEDIFGSLGPSYLLAAGVAAVGSVAAILLPDARQRTSEQRTPG